MYRRSPDPYLRAIEEGADGVECDVRLTRDGRLGPVRHCLDRLGLPREW